MTLADEELATVLTEAYGSPEWTLADVCAARAIESAATAPLIARIAELDRSLDVMAQNTEAQAHASLQREIELAEKVEKLERELEEERRKAQEDNYEFNRAINFAIDQGSEACHFLSAWREGDAFDWPEFNAAIKEQT